VRSPDGRQAGRKSGRERAAAAAERRELRAQLTDPAPVMEAAATFLAVRPRSISETRRRLAKLGYPEPLVEHVITRLVEMEYLDDADFARGWVQSRDRAKPRGEIALRRELLLKGVERAVIDDVLAQRAESAAGSDADRDAARALLERRRAAFERIADPLKRRQRAYSLLARNGFDPETCREVSAGLVTAAAE
jgi:regulatory protein